MTNNYSLFSNNVSPLVLMVLIARNEVLLCDWLHLDSTDFRSFGYILFSATYI